MRDVRVCVFGDALVAGVGDPKALGWVGRVAARTPHSTGIELTAYPLGVRRQTIEEIVLRMPMECAPRFAQGDEHRVVVAAGLDDAVLDVDPARSAAALEFGLGSLGLPALIVGPPPVGDDAVRSRIEVLDAALADLCAQRGDPYISTARALAAHPAWPTTVATDGLHPNQTGHGLLAAAVLRGGWYDWLGVSPPSEPVRRRSSPPAADGA